MSLEDDVARYFTARLADAHDVAVSKLYRIPGGASRETLHAAIDGAMGAWKTLTTPAKSKKSPAPAKPPRRRR